ncbi:MAG: hypothetical protein SFT94_05580 [Pseudanabaenaceae cyanobacterium bins.68]|nr:hypothetical protein [Pseudanabaenaceae cyanobacterium bins.68]
MELVSLGILIPFVFWQVDKTVKLNQDNARQDQAIKELHDCLDSVSDRLDRQIEVSAIRDEATQALIQKIWDRLNR